MRRQIERAFGVPVFDVFGSWETDNIAWECREHVGYHLAIDCVIAEIVCDGMWQPGKVVNSFAPYSTILQCDLLDDIAVEYRRATTRTVICGP